MTSHPYRSLPDHCFWKRSIAETEPGAVDPVVAAKFRITPRDRVVTAGSCFAQHIARHLQKNHFNFFITEPAHPLLPSHLSELFGYGVFTARYANLYTSRQLLQLLQRAYGMFAPADDVWQRADGRCIDPYRPQIQPEGFASLAEFKADRRQHLQAVRTAVEQLDVLVFTLGLTETWVNRADGAAYPLCPGVAGGEFDASRHAFLNLGVGEVIQDMRAAIDLIRQKNPKARVILTVSPVPLVATAEPRSVLVSTTWSKSVLRVAAGEIADGDAGVAYFPSYEIITGNFNRGAYFASDLRSVTEDGVAHVMRLFMQHYAQAADADPGSPQPAESAELRMRRQIEAAASVVKVMCEEEALDAGVAATDAEIAGLIADAFELLRQSNWAAAERLCATLRERAPDSPDGYALAGFALIQLDRRQEAREMLLPGVRRFPADQRFLQQLAGIAEHQGEPETAVRLAEELRRRLPFAEVGYVIGVRALRAAGRLEESEQLAASALGQFPGSQELHRQLCFSAFARQDWEGAVVLWTELLVRFPASAGDHRYCIDAFRMVGRLEEAEALRRESALRFPGDPAFALAETAAG